jgi:hypothetical protein
MAFLGITYCTFYHSKVEKKTHSVLSFLWWQAQCYIQWVYKAPPCIILRVKTWVAAYFEFHPKLKKKSYKSFLGNFLVRTLQYQIHFFSSQPWAAQTAQTEEFMFQNVAYRPVVYKTGVKGFFWGNKWKYFTHIPGLNLRKFSLLLTSPKMDVKSLSLSWEFSF